MAMREKQLGALGMRTNEKGQGYKFQPTKVLGVYTFTKRCNVEEFETKPRKTVGYSTVTHFNVVHVDCHMSATCSDVATSPQSRALVSASPLSVLEKLLVWAMFRDVLEVPGYSSSGKRFFFVEVSFLQLCASPSNFRSNGYIPSVMLSTSIDVVEYAPERTLLKTPEHPSLFLQYELARARDEWESAALQNANTKCNGLLPLWGPQVPESAFASCLARHNTYLQECTGHRYSSFEHFLVNVDSIYERKEQTQYGSDWF
uniref:E3 ubiquitin ligase UBR4 C-terminal domain-containing protein n=1 Tax=Timema genevievae TaxID=629358 RepID=A0A7R9K9P2_TIMGE|nr:unnamed protein product [Timema genevievae]